MSRGSAVWGAPTFIGQVWDQPALGVGVGTAEPPPDPRPPSGPVRTGEDNNLTYTPGSDASPAARTSASDEYLCRAAGQVWDGKTGCQPVFDPMVAPLPCLPNDFPDQWRRDCVNEATLMQRAKAFSDCLAAGGTRTLDGCTPPPPPPEAPSEKGSRWPLLAGGAIALAAVGLLVATLSIEAPPPTSREPT